MRALFIRNDVTQEEANIDIEDFLYLDKWVERSLKIDERTWNRRMTI